MTNGKPGLDAFDHLVVLMLENRSFDNMLGYLYEPGQVPRDQPFDGVAGKGLSNPAPEYILGAGHPDVPVARGTVMNNPNPDPGEPYPHINTQLFGGFIPPANWHKEVPTTPEEIKDTAKYMAPPYNLPGPPLPDPDMSGFVTDYVGAFHGTKGRLPTREEYSVIMNCFPPDAIPVTSGLAKAFGVFDHWFCSVPSQTFCNRSFFHAGTSCGRLTNKPYIDWVERTAPTIFNRISEAEPNGPTWKVYYDKDNGLSATLLISFLALFPYAATHFAHMDVFYEDVENGTLPSYAFVEPRLFREHNDMHPPGDLFGIFQRSSVLAGEVLVNDVYNAIRTSSSAAGSNRLNTAFMITFDEHGGCYDHVPPPAVKPHTDESEGQYGFSFDRAGVRVPTILVSAFIKEGTVINDHYEHTSVIRTICEKWGLEGLTTRDKKAPDLSGVFNLTTHRALDTWPTITPRPYTPEGAQAAGARAPRGLERDLATLALLHAGKDTSKVKDLKTVDEIVECLKTAKKELKL